MQVIDPAAQQTLYELYNREKWKIMVEVLHEMIIETGQKIVDLGTY